MSTSVSKREAKADKAAEKARAKAQRNWFSRHKILTGLAALFIVIIGFSAANSGGSTPAPAAAPAPQTSSPAAAPAPAAPAAAPAAKAPAAKPKPAAPAMTAGQSNALRAAQNYLSFTAFSRKGLIHQLSSSAGDGYSVKDATYAADHVNANWNEQAAKAAKNYLSMTSFSRAGLIHQLSSSAGDNYTLDQAKYGVKKAGL
jgi:hypothetical protein